MYKICEGCGKEFRTYPSRTGKYCSKACRTVDLTGQKIGRLTVLGDKEKRGNVRYDKVQCDCGTIKRVQHRALTEKRTLSCGCYMREMAYQNGKKPKKHGGTGTRLYKIYCCANWRCTKERDDCYHEYGGRGIKFLWNSFEEFKRDMGESYEAHVKEFGEKNTTIDRIDVNGNYCKENCRWATLQEQSNNKRNNHYITYNGETLSVANMCRKYGLKLANTYYLLKRGYSFSAILDHYKYKYGETSLFE